jgi:glycosyltransferase involved in cell wall biosynthesis
LWKNLLHQSYQFFQWIISTDQSSSECNTIFHEIQNSHEFRIHVLSFSDQESVGRSTARNALLSLLKTKYFVFIDQDDLIELVYLEKALWMIESTQAHAIMPFHIGFGRYSYRIHSSYHNGLLSIFNNTFLGSGLVYSTKSFYQSQCRYDERFDDSESDLDFNLCLALSGFWGITLEEEAYWRRTIPNMTSSPFKQVGTEPLKKKIRRLGNTQGAVGGRVHPSLPKIPTGRAMESHISIRIYNKLFQQNCKGRVLMLLPWSYVGGADALFLDVVRFLSNHHYKITILFTLYQPPHSVALRDSFYQYTHDIWTLPLILRQSDWSGFLRYVIDTRQIEVIIVSNCEWGYDMMPAIDQWYGNQVSLIDWIHTSSGIEWKSGGYSKISALWGAHLKMTIAVTDAAKKYLLAHGRHPSTVATLMTGVNTKFFTKDPSRLRESIDALNFMDLKKIRNPFIIVHMARLSEEKRHVFALDTLVAMREKLERTDPMAAKRIFYLVVGDGPTKDKILKAVLLCNCGSWVFLTGTLSGEKKWHALNVANLFYLPSAFEGASVAVTEAMSMGLAILATGTDALSEILKSPKYGITIRMKDRLNQAAYVESLLNIFKQAQLRDQLGKSARIRAVNYYDSNKNLQNLFSIFGQARFISRSEMIGNPVNVYLAHERLTSSYSLLTDISLRQEFLDEPPS